MEFEDFYQTLELDPEAGAGDIRKAYFRMAKRYHPDLSSGEEGQDQTERFLAIQQAYEVLSDVNRRASYDQMRRAGEASANAATAVAHESGPTRPQWAPREPSIDELRDARKAYMKVESLIAMEDWERAADTLRVIVKTVPNEPEYESKFGYVLARAGQSLHRARDYCRRAVQAEPYNADFHAQLGYVYLQAGLDKTAQECLREALNYDPTHELALHLYNEDGGGSGGLLGRLKSMFGR